MPQGLSPGVIIYAPATTHGGILYCLLLLMVAKRRVIHYTRENIILFGDYTRRIYTVWRLHKVEYHTVWRLHKVEYNVWRLHKENIILFDGCQKMSPACRVTVCNLGKIFSNRDGSWSLQLIVNQAWTFSEFQTQQRHLTWDSHRCGSVILPSEGGFQQIVCNLFTIPGNTV